MDYLLHLLVLIGIYSILAISLNLLVGYTGLLSVAQASFFGLGAYISSLLSIHLGIPFLLNVLLSGILAAVASLLISLPTARLHEDYFVIATFSFQIIAFNVFNNWVGLTNGPMGLRNIPYPQILGWEIQSATDFIIVTSCFASFSYFIARQISTSPFGRVLRAIREDEVFPQSLGKNTLRFKIVAFAVSAALASTAGVIYAHYISFINPNSFTVLESVLIISMVIIGGADSRWGPVIGAIILIILPEMLRFVGLPNSISANIRQIIYGGLLVIMVAVRPRGLLGRYELGK